MPQPFDLCATLLVSYMFPLACAHPFRLSNYPDTTRVFATPPRSMVHPSSTGLFAEGPGDRRDRLTRIMVDRNIATAATSGMTVEESRKAKEEVRDVCPPPPPSHVIGPSSASVQSPPPPLS